MFALNSLNLKRCKLYLPQKHKSKYSRISYLPAKRHSGISGSRMQIFSQKKICSGRYLKTQPQGPPVGTTQGCLLELEQFELFKQSFKQDPVTSREFRIFKLLVSYGSLGYIHTYIHTNIPLKFNHSKLQILC